MKKFIILLLLAMPVFGFSQTGHLAFKGIPVNGSKAEFISQLEEAGFSLVSSEDDYAVMDGVFINKDCEIQITATPDNENVWKVAALLPENDDWASLRSEYRELKQLYTKKYGKPANTYEFFKEPFYEGDGKEMQALQKNKCTYASIWKTEKGKITIQIGQNYLVLTYEDKINSDLKTEELNSKLEDEI